MCLTVFISLFTQEKLLKVWKVVQMLPMEFIMKCDSFLQVSMVLSALQAGNKGTQACITAASSVSGIIADLDTTIMFASAGTLNAENEESFADHRWEMTECETTELLSPRNRNWYGGAFFKFLETRSVKQLIATNQLQN